MAEIKPINGEVLRQLQARYPGVRIVEAFVREFDGSVQQGIRYQAPRAELERCGLLIADMVRGGKCNGAR